MKKRIIAFLMMVVMIGSIVTSCSKDKGNGGDISSESGDESLIVALPEPPTYMDPQIQASTVTYRVTTQVFDRLVHLDYDMNIVPALAESWEVEDEKTTVFHLRKGVKFHDGEEMTSEDVKYSLERCIESNGVNYNYLIISDIIIEDDYTIKIVTKEPFNALLYRLALDAASIVSKKAATSGDDFNANPVGAGPYKFVSWDLGGDVVLEAFPDYYKGEPKVKKLVFRAVPEAINRTIGLEANEVQMAYDLAVTDLDKIKSNDKLSLKEATSTTVWYLGFNTEKENLDNKMVRQAIAHAINMEDFIKIVFNDVATPAKNTMLVPMLFGYSDNVKQYNYDLSKSKELLEEAGHPNGFDTTLWVADNQIQKDASVVIQDQLRQVGININIKTMDQGNFYSATGKGEHDLFFLSKTSVDPDSMLRAMYHTEAFGLSGNRSFWATEEVDSMLDKASTTTDENESKELYKNIQDIVAEELPILPIAIEHINVGINSEVKGFELFPGKSHYIYETYIER